MAMSDLLAGDPAKPVASSYNSAAALAAFFASLLIGSECVAVAGATSWAVGSAFGIGGTLLTILEGVAVAGSLVLTALFARKAFQAERKYRTNRDAL